MTENDWNILLKWNSDPAVLYFSEGGNISPYNLETVQEIYRTVSQAAYCFIIEFDDRPIGECWLQRMNLERILSKHPALDCRRIDLMIGEKDYWHLGIGTEAVNLLVRFGFEQEKADAIFACDVGDYNLASLKMFQKCGFEIYDSIPQKPGNKARICYDLVLTKERFNEIR